MAKNNWGNYTQSHVDTISNDSAVFLSYNTPVVIHHKGMTYKVDKKFSSTTSKQTTIYLRQYPNYALISKDVFIKLLKDIDYRGWLGWLGGY
jgi:hypothetical protein